MAQKFTIYPLNQSHLVQINEIEQSSHLTPWSENTIRNSFGPRSHNYGLFIKDKPFDVLVGYCFTDLVAGELSIENICISNEFQNQGLGNKLLQAVIDDSIKRPVVELFLEVRSSNLPAISLYQKLGFNECGRRKGYYSAEGLAQREDAILMQRLINH